MRIRCKGDQVTITLNGEKVVDADMNAYDDLKGLFQNGTYSPGDFLTAFIARAVSSSQ